MAWFKVDDTLHSHPKIRQAGLPAAGLWVAAGAYSAAYNLAGFVPAHYVAGWGSQGVKAAKALVDAGLWEVAADEGWRFHDWEDYQLSAEEIERERELARMRQRRRRDALRESRAERTVA